MHNGREGAGWRRGRRSTVANASNLPLPGEPLRGGGKKQGAHRSLPMRAPLLPMARACGQPASWAAFQSSASTTATALMLTMPRTVMESETAWAGYFNPVNMGPTGTASPSTFTML